MPATIEPPLIAEPAAAPAASPAADAAPLRWTRWPLRDRPLAIGALLAGVIALAAVAGARVGSPLVGAMVAAALVGTLQRLLLPLTYEFTEHGLELTRLGQRRTIGWRRIRAFRSTPEGATLSIQPLNDRGPRATTTPVEILFPESPLALHAELRKRLSSAREIA